MFSSRNFDLFDYHCSSPKISKNQQNIYSSLIYKNIPSDIKKTRHNIAAQKQAILQHRCEAVLRKNTSEKTI